MRPLASFTQSGKRSFIYVIYHVAFLFVPEKLALVTTFPDGSGTPCRKRRRNPVGKSKDSKTAPKAKKSAKDRNAKAPMTHCPGCKKSCPLVKPKCGKGKKLAAKLGVR